MHRIAPSSAKAFEDGDEGQREPLDEVGLRRCRSPRAGWSGALPSCCHLRVALVSVIAASGLSAPLVRWCCESVPTALALIYRYRLKVLSAPFRGASINDVRQTDNWPTSSRQI